VRHEFDLIAVWRSDRIGQSLSHLAEVLQTIRESGTGLYINAQSVDTTTTPGQAIFGILGIFSEFEREIHTNHARRDYGPPPRSGDAQSQTCDHADPHRP
jgi:DNA invertase Pin-like site-specific DNA recombinase